MLLERVLCDWGHRVVPSVLRPSGVEGGQCELSPLCGVSRR